MVCSTAAATYRMKLLTYCGYLSSVSQAEAFVALWLRETFRVVVQQLLALCRLGAIARKHGSYASCVRMTNTLYGFNAMEVQEAFVKIREQVSVEQLSHEP